MYIDGLLFLIWQHLLGLLSIGPCTALVIRTSLYDRISGLKTVLGATLGSFSIKTISVLGFAVLMMQNPNLFAIFKLLGGGYLIYLGILSIIRSFKEFGTKATIRLENNKENPFIAGYFMSMSNPLSSIRFIALFSTAISSDISLFAQISYLLILALISLVFYGMMALFFSTHKIQDFLNKYRFVLSFILGCTLIYWGSKIFLVAI
jgi:threonine/homoserine/homoserine lactone efflux protein